MVLNIFCYYESCKFFVYLLLYSVRIVFFNVVKIDCISYIDNYVVFN